MTSISKNSDAVAVLVAEAWASRRAAFESSCRSGSAAASTALPDPEGVILQMARDFEAAARRDLLAIRNAYYRNAAPADVTIDLPGVETPNAFHDITPADSGTQAFVDNPERTSAFDPLGADVFAHAATPSMTGAYIETPTAATKPTRRPLPPTPKVPGYAIHGVLGHGGMGVVYKATHLALKRDVALKMILKGEHASPESIERFLAEARAVAKINHPNIVQIYQIDEHDGLPSFALEFCSGGSLDRVLNKEPIPPAKAAAYAETLARALQAAHDVGVIHRDIKPANVLMAGDGTLKVTDFGLARVATEDTGERTGAGSVLGSPSYMPPEQAAGRQDEVGPLSDQYSLGATLYEFLTGGPPFRGTTSMDTLKQVMNREPVPPSTLQPGVPKDLETICLKALSKDSGKRYPSAAAMAEDLEAYQEGRPISARPVSRWEKTWRWAKRNPRVAGLLAAVAALLTTLAVGGAIFTAVFRAKSIEAENNFHEAENRGVQLTAALDQAKANLKEANENYDFARENAIVMAQTIPNELRRRVLDPTVRASIIELITKTMLERKTGSRVRQLPDRILYTGLLQQFNQALDHGDFAKANESLLAVTEVAKRMVETEPVEKDKADGHYARVLEARANYHRRRALVPKLTDAEFKQELELGRNLIAEAVAMQRRRVASPRSPEMDLADRKYNLAQFLSAQSKFQTDAAEAHRYLDEAIELQEAVMKEPRTENTVKRARAELASMYHQRSEIFRNQQKRDERKTALLTAIAELTQYHADHPEDTNNRRVLAQWNRDLGDLIFLNGDRVGPLPYYRTAFDLTRPLLTDPRVLALQEEFAADAFRAGLAALEKKDAVAAAAHFRSSFRLAEEAVAQGRTGAVLMNLAALSAARAGEITHANAWAAKVEALSAKSPSQLMEAACCYATIAGGVTAIDMAVMSAEKKTETKAAAVAKAIDLLTKWRDVLNAPANAKNLSKNMSSFLRRLETEPDLDGIRDTPAFQKFLATTKTGNDK